MPVDMALGALSKRLTIQSRTTTPDSQGGRAVTYAVRAVVWGQIEALSYREALMASQVTTTYTTKVTIPFRTDVSVTDRVVHVYTDTSTNRPAARYFEVMSLQDPTGEQIITELFCAEVQA